MKLKLRKFILPMVAVAAVFAAAPAFAETKTITGAQTKTCVGPGGDKYTEESTVPCRYGYSESKEVFNNTSSSSVKSSNSNTGPNKNSIMFQKPSDANKTVAFRSMDQNSCEDSGGAWNDAAQNCDCDPNNTGDKYYDTDSKKCVANTPAEKQRIVAALNADDKTKNMCPSTLVEADCDSAAGYVWNGTMCFVPRRDRDQSEAACRTENNRVQAQQQKTPGLVTPYSMVWDPATKCCLYTEQSQNTNDDSDANANTPGSVGGAAQNQQSQSQQNNKPAGTDNSKNKSCDTAADPAKCKELQQAAA
ncbi:MAG: hypothetical protein FWC51_03695, partial [Proteobacteria bacterium]|nr:hypothetical protein [Pseudomonadota bacterium]